MPATQKITLNLVKAMQSRQTVFDVDVSGFGIRCQSQAHYKSYFVKYRNASGQQKFYTIGRHGSPWTPDTARKEALNVLSRIVQGEDPAAERKANRARHATAPSIEGEVGRFLDIHCGTLKPQTAREYRRLFDKHILPKFGKQHVDAVARTDIAKWHASMSTTPRQANFALAVFSKFFAHAEDIELRPANSNPCQRVKRYKERKRERFLTTDEFKRLGAAIAQAEADGINPYAISAIRLLIFTGCRLGEILSLKHEYINYQQSRILLPDSKTGEKAIVLSNPAKEVLQNIPRLLRSPYVLPSEKTNTHLESIQKPWRAIRAAADLPDLRVHDLRHSFASVGASSGASLPMIGALLGHTQASTTQRYAHLADGTLAELNERIGGTIADAMDSQKSSSSQ